jgi:hypothetical protein
MAARGQPVKNSVLLNNRLFMSGGRQRATRGLEDGTVVNKYSIFNRTNDAKLCQSMPKAANCILFDFYVCLSPYI